MEVSRITIDGLKHSLDNKEQVFIIDTRSPAAWESSNVKISGAVRIHYSELEQHLSEIPRDRTVVTYCTWHNEASSVRAAEILMSKGFDKVYALKDGFDAWNRAGYPVEKLQRGSKFR